MTKKELQKKVSIKLPEGNFISVWLHLSKNYQMIISIFYNTTNDNETYYYKQNKQAKRDFKLIYKYIFKEEF